ncbi:MULTISPECIES: hypothetical protein [Micromonospora]|uniref:Uncharacterized protein n=1 Tax=Micromonospora yangpuensis TaxID=683228 RepID=A0A1C6UPC1_9ACTN|nr:hypothetical protein [Micromonospora yangpuensis]SCL55895.1 hypothetical protein GA0070617_3087 [Micromonospora yangpuensis]
MASRATSAAAGSPRVISVIAVRAYGRWRTSAGAMLSAAIRAWPAAVGSPAESGLE